MSNAGELTLLGSDAVPCCPPLTERALTAEEAEHTAGMFKALGDPVRLRLFSMIASQPEGEACVCDISDVGVSQPTVSHHLKKLREAGLLTSQRRGTWVYYRIEPSVLAAMGRSLGPAVRQQVSRTAVETPTAPAPAPGVPAAPAAPTAPAAPAEPVGEAGEAEKAGEAGK